MERLGIFPRWETESQLLDQVNDIWNAWIDSKWALDRNNLEAYSQGGNPYPDTLDLGESRLLSPSVRISLGGCSQYESARAMRILFGSGNKLGWENILAFSWSYEYWCARIDQYKQVYSTRTDFRASLNQAVEVLSICLCAGWIEQAKLLTEEIRVLYERRRFFDDGYYPLYHWFLRVCFHHWSLPFNKWGRPDEENPQALSQPILNELFEHWCDVDLTPMQDHVIWLCDYYTHRTRRKDWYEFSNSHLLTRFPALILAWQRLREMRGLESPVIDHPLMHPAYARLRPAVPFYTDPVLEAALGRLRREEMPDLGGVRQLSLPVSSEKRSLIARLFGRT